MADFSMLAVKVDRRDSIQKFQPLFAVGFLLEGNVSLDQLCNRRAEGFQELQGF